VSERKKIHFRRHVKLLCRRCGSVTPWIAVDEGSAVLECGHCRGLELEPNAGHLSAEHLAAQDKTALRIFPILETEFEGSYRKKKGRDITDILTDVRREERLQMLRETWAEAA
jgi:hypothetical protein